MQARLHRHWANLGGMDAGNTTQALCQSGGGGMDAGKATQALGQSEGYGCRQCHTGIGPIWGVWIQARLQRHLANGGRGGGMDSGNATQAVRQGHVGYPDG